MKLSNILSIFLGALSIGVSASPIPSNDVQGPVQSPAVLPEGEATRLDSLGKRNNPIEETNSFKQFANIHQDMKKDQYYAFTVKWTKGDAPGDRTPEKKMQEIQRMYGFDHIALVVGQVTEKATGKGKNTKTTRDFNAVMHHLKTFEGLKTEYDHPNWKYSSRQDDNDKVKIEF